MSETHDRASPPLSSKGYYSLDFEALDGNINSCKNEKEITNTQPTTTKPPDDNTAPMKEPLKEPSLPDSNDPVENDNRISTESTESSGTLKKRKIKSSSSKQGTVVVSRTGDGDNGEREAGLEKMAVDEKPIKQRKSGKKLKSRPMSTSFDEQEMQKKLQQAEESTNMSVSVSGAIPHTISDVPQNSTPSQHPQTQTESQLSEKDSSSKKIASHSKKTAAQVSETIEGAPQQEKPSSLPEETTLSAEKSPPVSKKHRTRSASIASEDGTDVRPRKEKGSAKSKKSKSKKSSSSSRREDAEGSVEGVEVSMGDSSHADERRHARKSSRRRNSYGDTSDVKDSKTDEGVKAKPSTIHVSEKLVTKGDPGMTSSHSKESVVKLVQVMSYSQTDWNKLRQDLDGSYQTQLLARDQEWSIKVADRDARLAALEDANKKLRQTHEDMKVVMGEFEKTIGQLQSEKEKSKNASQQSLQDVLKEKDQAVEDLRSVETAFSDLHRRYEKTKAVVDDFKQNEETLKKCVQDLQNKLKKSEQKTQTLKAQAEDKLDRAAEELEKMKKTSASEIAKLEAALRKAHVQIESMEAALEQKVKENKELTAICDELIGKVQ